MGPELQQAVTELYAAFADYPRPAFIEGCECCWGGDGALQLHEGEVRGSVRVPAPGGSRPLHALAPTEISNVAAEVPFTGGTLEVFKHYLPRIFEIAAGDGFDWPDLEVVVERINLDEKVGCRPWAQWPQDEQAALRRFLRALWRERLANEAPDDDGCAVDAALCAVALVEPTLEWYLEEWLRFDRPAVSLNFERFLQRNLRSIAKGKIGNAFWHTDSATANANSGELMAWIKSEQTLQSVGDAAERARTPAEREALEECFLRWLPACAGPSY
ncbi:MAG: hypothetical protein M3Q48_05480 [Actinomycetota bacterium]|nr:hypothetical protein [Actinomycetota bacterium]